MQALGLIETIGLIAAVVSADAMLKAAEVTLIDKTYVGGGLVSIAVTGGVAAVRSAIEAGSAAVKQINSSLLVSQHVIPRPHEEIDELLLPKKAVKNKENRIVEPTATESVEPINSKSSEPTGIGAIEESADKTIEDLAASNTVVEDPVAPEPVVEQLVPEVLAVEEPLYEAPIVEEFADNGTVDEEPTVVETEQESSIDGSIVVHPIIKKSVLPDLESNEINKAYIDKLALEHGAEKAIEFLSTLKVTKLRSLAREYENLGIAGRIISRSDGKTLISEFMKYYE